MNVKEIRERLTAWEFYKRKEVSALPQKEIDEYINDSFIPDMKYLLTRCEKLEETLKFIGSKSERPDSWIAQRDLVKTYEERARHALGEE